MSLSKYFKGIGRMSTRKNPPREEEEMANDSPPSFDSLLKEITKMNTTLMNVATDVLTIKETTTELKTTVTAMQERLSEAETRIVRLEEVANGRNLTKTRKVS